MEQRTNPLFTTPSAIEEAGAKIQSLCTEFADQLYELCQKFRKAHEDDNVFLVWNAEFNALLYVAVGTFCAKVDNQMMTDDMVSRLKFNTMATGVLSKMLFELRTAAELFYVPPKEPECQASEN